MLLIPKADLSYDLALQKLKEEIERRKEQEDRKQQKRDEKEAKRNSVPVGV